MSILGFPSKSSPTLSNKYFALETPCLISLFQKHTTQFQKARTRVERGDKPDYTGNQESVVAFSQTQQLPCNSPWQQRSVVAICPWHSIRHVVRINQRFPFRVLAPNVNSLYRKPEQQGKVSPCTRKVCDGYPNALTVKAVTPLLGAATSRPFPLKPRAYRCLTTALGPKKLRFF